MSEWNNDLLSITNGGKGELEWISVKDRLPEEKQYILYYCSNYKKIDKTQFYYGNFLGTSNASNNITHWMYLPSPPKD